MERSQLELAQLKFGPNLPPTHMSQIAAAAPQPAKR